MSSQRVKYIFLVTSSILFIALLYKIIKLPAGLILPGYIMGGLLLIGVLIGCLIVTGIIKLMFKRTSFLTSFLIVTTVAFVGFHYSLYSPTLKIIVPEGYTGQVTLVLSNLDENILNVDSNGIGYITQWTFDNTYTTPDVVDTNEKVLNDRCVGYAPFNFWAKGYATSTDHPNKVHYLSFEIVPLNHRGKKQRYNPDITSLVDSSKLLRK